MTSKQEFIAEHERIIALAKLRALSAVSLERPLTEEEYRQMMELKEQVGLG